MGRRGERLSLSDKKLPTLWRAASSSKVPIITNQRKCTRLKDSTTLKQFRHDIYDCFLRAKDALFNTIDALITETQAKSFPEISQSLWFERKWSSLYEAFEDGRIDEKRLRDVFATYLPKPQPAKVWWIGIDGSSIARPEAVTSADRTAQHVHNLPECKKPITFGWQFSTVVALADPASSWTYILDQQRVASQTTAIEEASAQLKRLAPHLPKNAIVMLDRGYDANWLWCRCSALDIGVLGRLKSNRCLYRPAPAPTGKKGCPRKDGAKLQPKDPLTHGEPDGMWKGSDAKGRPVEVTCWKRLHVKQARWLEVTVLQVVRSHATNKERDPRVSWFVWIGDQEADVFQIALSYVLRFGQEHGYRFDKQALLWETPRLRTPEQFERWSHTEQVPPPGKPLSADQCAKTASRLDDNASGENRDQPTRVLQSRYPRRSGRALRRAQTDSHRRPACPLVRQTNPTLSQLRHRRGARQE